MHTCTCICAQFSKSHSSFCTAVPGEERGPFDLEALAEGADTVFTMLISLPNNWRLVYTGHTNHFCFSRSFSWFPFTGALPLLSHDLDRAAILLFLLFYHWRTVSALIPLQKLVFSFKSKLTETVISCLTCILFQVLAQYNFTWKRYWINLGSITPLKNHSQTS